VLLVHPGTQHAPRLAEELDRRGLLWRFWTGWARGASASGSGKRRVGIPTDRLRTLPLVEWTALLLSRSSMRKEIIWHWRNGLFQRLVPRREIEAADVVIGFDTAAWIIGARAKAAGKAFVLDQSVAHPLSRERVVRSVGGDATLWPEAFVPRARAVAEAEAAEQTLADVVVAASSFSKATLLENGVSGEKVRVVPYGVGAEFLCEDPTSRQGGAAGRGLRFLYAGYLTKRKGVGTLLDAWRGLGVTGAELRLAGGGGWDGPLPADVRLLGQVSREVLREEMARADVFVFPSLFEGFGLVLLEAMAAGLPVITTPNTAGPDLMSDGEAGWIVPPGDAAGLREAMMKFVREPQSARVMGERARHLAGAYTWGRYAGEYERIIVTLSSCLENR
jgi:glycosyltransferase involved in cell wall biosynthesis